MSATPAASAAPESSREASLPRTSPRATAVSSPLSEVENEVHHDTDKPRQRQRHASPLQISAEEDDFLDDDLTLTTLRSNPSPSRKRRESEAENVAPTYDRHYTKKRKREPSPPWHFPTAETTTLKTADGRRASARVNTGTPPINSDASARGRSSSVSVPPSLRPHRESPPWKKFEAPGPTSVVVNGKRMSGRVNKQLTDPPKRVSPRSNKHVISASRAGPGAAPKASSTSLHKAVDDIASRKTSAQTPKQSSKDTSRPSTASDSASKIAELRAQINALNPSRSFPSPERSKPAKSHKRKHSDEKATARLDEPTSPQQKRPSTKSLPSPDAHRPSPKIKLRFNAARYLVPPPHPHAIFPPPVRPPGLSLFQQIEPYELQELQIPHNENERGPPNMAWFVQRDEKFAVKEGLMRKKILEESKSGGMLSKERLSIYQEEEAKVEPFQQYGHTDHLVAHALYLRQLQAKEKTQHRQLAKKVAHEALELWKAKRGPTEEDLREEQDKMFRLIYKQVVADTKAKWDMVLTYVQQRRLQAWEAEEELKRQARLQEKLEWSENMVARQRGEAEDEDEFSGGESEDDGSAGSGNESDESEEENMSQSDSGVGESDVDEATFDDGEMGEDELAAYRAQREAEERDQQDRGLNENANMAFTDDDEAVAGAPSAHAHDSPQRDVGDVSMVDLLDHGQEDENNGSDFDFAPANHEAAVEGVHDEGYDTEHLRRHSRRSSATPASDHDDDEIDMSSDESTNMDSTDYDSDEDMSSTGDEDNAREEDDEQASDAEQRVPRNSLLSLFKDEIKATGLPTPTTSAEGDEVADVANVPAQDEHGDSANQDMLSADVKVEDVDNEAMVESQEIDQAKLLDSPETIDVDAAAKNLVPSPALLRGTLRSYQHAGLDWLASLYRNGTNGILADEMGLGKTIQTIALLAHLAEEHECWEAHLVIVPTSVVLNWVTEFQRFLPGFRVLGYYGSSEERQIKRKGWVNDPHHEDREKRGYNVVITSYNVAMQDINAIRNVQWHYLVLDEAHNIRNFNSQRWQILIRLRTKARLLLTGTPLQNSLTELWSLLTFLTAGDDDPQHGDLEEFLSHWKEPVKEIFDRGVQTLSSEAQKVVDQLHVSLRPFLLRRLKSEVEKDLPKKTESVVVCKLSKRQRELYQEYMGLAETRRNLTRGNAVTAGKVLLSLRRVCNHPDLFDPRPIQTSFAMEFSALDDFAVKEKLVRSLLGFSKDLPVRVTAHEGKRKYPTRRARQLNAGPRLEHQAQQLEAENAPLPEPDASTLAGCSALQKLRARERKVAELRASIRISEHNLSSVPIYGADLRETLTIRRNKPYRISVRDVRGRITGKRVRSWPSLGRYPLKSELDHVSDALLSQSTMLQRSVQTAWTYAERLQDTIVRFAFCTPVATAPTLNYSISARLQQDLRYTEAYPMEQDFAHEARTRTSIAFPDSRLLVYDAGKLQRLTILLRELQAKGSRSLIFTQMTGTLNILEQFLSLLNLPYLRLDGSTSVERRALYAAEFNRPDSKYQCMILSSRAGGVGLNLIGGSSVIFYDLDWNPQMDRQCMDRAHRIGQVRDVEVYKMVSEKTVEENILRRANQKSLLDQTVIQQGHFTTEYQQRSGAKDDDEDANNVEADVAAGIERVFGGGNEKAMNQALESVEDREDVQAAQAARKEEHQDDADFAEHTSSKGPSVPPTPGRIEEGEEDTEGKRHVDSYMIRLMEDVLLKGVVFVPPQVRKLDKHGRDPSHRKRKK